MTPEPASERAASVAFESPQPERVRAALEAERVLVTGELGRVRASVALFNTSDDVERAVRAIRAAVPASRR